MKKYSHISLLVPVFLLTLLCWWGVPAMAQVVTDGQVGAAEAQVNRTGQNGQGGRYEMVVTGTVRASDDGRKLENVTVALEGTSIGTVTNADGYFSLKFPRGVEPKLIFSHLGYENCSYVATEDSRGRYVANVRMKTALTELDLAIIFGDARGLVEAALKKVPENYPPSPNLLSSFYRETVQKGHRYISVAEAIMDVYKTGYTSRYTVRDAVSLTKARRLLSQKQSDTLGVKMAGGPNLSLEMDVVKNGDALYDEMTMDYYAFSMLPSEKIDDRLQYVVAFVPCVTLSYALYEGKVYIDRETLAFTRAEFSLDLSDIDKATAALLLRKPAGLRFRPQDVSFLVTYRSEGGVTRLNYMRCDMRFKCDWKKLAFSSSYIARSEMVVVEREESEGAVIDRKNAFRDTQVFYDIVQEYWDADYWADYNIIEPTESLENAVKRLKRKL